MHFKRVWQVVLLDSQQLTKERRMYGKVLGATNIATGISLLPATGSSRPLFIAASSLLIGGVAIFVAATVLARKSRVQSEAN